MTLFEHTVILGSPAEYLKLKSVGTCSRNHERKYGDLMSVISTEALPYFENAIYLPMIIKILEKDRIEIENASLKFRGPYLKIVERAEKLARIELKNTNIYFKRNNMQLIKKGNDSRFTEYEFIFRGYEENRRYLNVRLRNRTEELMDMYLTKTQI